MGWTQLESTLEIILIGIANSSFEYNLTNETCEKASLALLLEVKFENKRDVNGVLVPFLAQDTSVVQVVVLWIQQHARQVLSQKLPSDRKQTGGSLYRPPTRPGMNLATIQHVRTKAPVARKSWEARTIKRSWKFDASSI